MHALLPFSALLALLLPFTTAQDYGGGASSPSSTTSASSSASTSPAAGVQIVTVGAAGLSFSPSSLSAAVGSMVEFHFFPPTHSVAQSSFNTPCAPNNATGFWSGLIQSSGGANANVFRVTINDTNPIFFYCAFPTHCQSGMVGVINPSTNPAQSLANYQTAAANSGTSVEPPTVQGGVIGVADTASGTAPAPSATPTKSDGESLRSTLMRPWVVFAVLFLGWLIVGGC